MEYLCETHCNSNLMITRLPITYFTFIKSFWHFAQSTAVSQVSQNDLTSENDVMDQWFEFKTSFSLISYSATNPRSMQIAWVNTLIRTTERHLCSEFDTTGFICKKKSLLHIYVIKHIYHALGTHLLTRVVALYLHLTAVLDAIQLLFLFIIITWKYSICSSIRFMRRRLFDIHLY